MTAFIPKLIIQSIFLVTVTSPETSAEPVDKRTIFHPAGKAMKVLCGPGLPENEASREESVVARLPQQ